MMEALQILTEDIEPIDINCRSTNGTEMIGAREDNSVFTCA